MAGSLNVGMLRAILSADTSEFTRAMAAATEDGRKFGESLQKNIEPRQRAVNAAVKDFLGTSEIRRAQEYAMAVEKIGGVTQLTANDQLKVNRAVSEALDHYKALGTTAPAHLVKLQQETTQVQSVWEKADTALGKFGLSLRGLTVAGIGAGIVALGKEAIAFGSHLTDLRDATGLSLQELQRLDFAGSQVGVSLDTSAKGVQKLQKALIEDKDGGAAGAIKKLGLDVDALLAMSPGEMFESMGKALATLPTPAERTTTAIQILSRTGPELLPLLLANIDELTKGMHSMSDETVEAADRFDDAWARMKFNMRSEVGQMIGALGSLRGALNLVAGNDGRSASWMAMFDNVDRMHESLAKFAATAKGPNGAPTPFGATGKDLDNLMAAAQAMNVQTEAQIKAGEAAETYRKKIAALADEYTGKAIAAKVTELNDALQAAGGIANISSKGVEKMAKDAKALREAGATLTPVLADLAYGLDILEFAQRNLKLTGESIPAMLKRIGGEAKLATPPLITLSDTAREFAFHLATLDRVADAGKGPASIRAISQLGTVIKPLKGDVDDAFGAIAGSFVQMSQVSGSEMGEFARNIGVGITAVSNLRTAVDTMVKDGIAGFAGFVSGAGALLAIRDLIPTWVSGDVQKLREEIAKFGSAQPVTEEEQIQARIDRLKEQAAALPTFGSEHALRVIREGLEYWQEKLDRIRETNQRIADEQEEQAAEQEARLREEGEARDKLQAAIDKYGFTIEELGPKWKQQRMTEQAKDLVEDFTVLVASGIEVETVIQHMGKEINEFVRKSIKMGTEVPEQMRPMLEKMIEMGDLTYDNGEKITDLSEINFGMTMSEGFQGVIDKLDELIGKLTEDLGKAITQERPPVVIDVETRQHTTVFPPQYVEGAQPNPNDPFGGFDPGNPDDQTPAMAGGGVVRPRRGGTLVRLAEAGYPETVMPGDWSELVNGLLQQPSVGPMAVGGDGASASYSVPTIITQVYLDSRQIAEATVPKLGQVMERLRLT